jgi:hypothetical protein
MSQDWTVIGNLQLIAESLDHLTEDQNLPVLDSLRLIAERLDRLTGVGQPYLPAIDSLRLIAERLAQLTGVGQPYLPAIDSLRLIAERLDRLIEVSQPSAVRYGPTGGTGPEEETIVCMSLGTGTVRHGVDGQAYFIVHGHLGGVNGAPDGEFEGVWAAHVFTPQDLVNYPDPPASPFDRPFKPGEAGWNPALNPTKAKWTFGHGRGWLEAVGPALARIQVQSDGHTQFWYSVAAFVTSGGGVYEGVRGQATSMGSAYFLTVPQPLEGLSFDLNAVHVLKVVHPR